LLALFGAVQTPLAALAVRLLLNYPAQTGERDIERSGVFPHVKGITTIRVQERRLGQPSISAVTVGKPSLLESLSNDSAFLHNE
jgi:hypothetical protein